MLHRIGQRRRDLTKISPHGIDRDQLSRSLEQFYCMPHARRCSVDDREAVPSGVGEGRPGASTGMSVQCRSRLLPITRRASENHSNRWRSSQAEPTGITRTTGMSTSRPSPTHPSRKSPTSHAASASLPKPCSSPSNTGDRIRRVIHPRLQLPWPRFGGLSRLQWAVRSHGRCAHHPSGPTGTQPCGWILAGQPASHSPDARRRSSSVYSSDLVSPRRFLPIEEDMAENACLVPLGDGS